MEGTQECIKDLTIISSKSQKKITNAASMQIYGDRKSERGMKYDNCQKMSKKAQK